MSSQRVNARIKWTCFIIYSTFLFLVLFCRRIPTGLDLEQYPYWSRILDNINLIPLDTISEQVHDIFSDSGYYERLAILNLSANIIMFIPMGFFMPALWSKLFRFLPCIITGVLMIISVEIVQLFTLLGSFDIDDILLNLAGIVIGYLLLRGYQFLRIWSKKEEH